MNIYEPAKKTKETRLAYSTLTGKNLAENDISPVTEVELALMVQKPR